MLRTSTSDPIRVDFLPLPMPRRVGLTFAPGKCDGFRWQRSLAQDLDRLQAHYEVAHLVSLIEDHELAQYGIGNLYAEAERRGIATHRFPIRDVSVPADVECVAPLVRRIGEWVAVREKVATASADWGGQEPWRDVPGRAGPRGRTRVETPTRGTRP